MRSVRGSETAEANRPGDEGAANGKQGSILAEGGGFVAGGISGHCQVSRNFNLSSVTSRS